jgi:tetratricopeptide (TPR) repeat protein
MPPLGDRRRLVFLILPADKKRQAARPSLMRKQTSKFSPALAPNLTPLLFNIGAYGHFFILFHRHLADAKKVLASLVLLFFLSGCDSFRVARQFAAGRRAFVAKNYEEALTYFQRAAQGNPNYIFESALYRQGIWNYIGRAQYHTGSIADARRSLEHALLIDRDDHVARIYLGLVRARAGDTAAGATYIERGMKGLYDWLEYYESSRPFEAFWDPRREIRVAIEKQLAQIASNRIEWPRLMTAAEWLGDRIEYEIDEVRRQESRKAR